MEQEYTSSYQKTINMTSDRISLVIVDDEKPARDILGSQLSSHEEVRVLASCATMDDAYKAITNHKPDAVFLDIELKRGNAFTLIERLKKTGAVVPAIILITGHSYFEYGIKSVDHRDCIVKILEKPFYENFDNIFESIMDLIHTYHSPKSPTENNPESTAIFVKFNNRTYRVNFDDISYLEVAGSGCSYLTMEDLQVITAPNTLNKLMSQLPKFITRISRYNAVNIRKIDWIDHKEQLVYLKGRDKGLGYGKNFYADFAKYIGLR